LARPHRGRPQAGTHPPVPALRTLPGPRGPGRTAAHPLPRPGPPDRRVETPRRRMDQGRGDRHPVRPRHRVPDQRPGPVLPGVDRRRGGPHIRRRPRRPVRLRRLRGGSMTGRPTPPPLETEVAGDVSNVVREWCPDCKAWTLLTGETVLITG